MVTRKERAQIEGMIELLKTEQRLDQENLQHGTESYARYSAGMLTKGTEVINMLTELLGEE